MLGEFEVMTNIAVKDLAESKKFYGETLGLKVMDDHDFGVLYGSGSGGGRLFVYQAPTAGTSQATIATWEVKDIKAVAGKIKAAGCSFEHYEFPGAEHDGDIHIMGGMKAAWFRDPSGNILGLSEGGNE
jgi:catechol 2,3-dioxygenase-like lactoylglutathione lyase family enzyme